MLAFTLDPRRWWIARPLSRNPLLRAADRLEALIILVVIVGWLLVVPVTGAVGTAIYDGRHRLYAEEALSQAPRRRYSYRGYRRNRRRL